MQWELIQTGHQWSKPGADVELQPQKWGFGLKISYLSSSPLFKEECVSTEMMTIRCKICMYFQKHIFQMF